MVLGTHTSTLVGEKKKKKQFKARFNEQSVILSRQVK